VNQKGNGEGGSYCGGRALVEAASGAKDLVELATGRVLEDEDDSLFFVEPNEEAEHVWVVETVLDLDLPPQVRVEAVLLQLRLEYHLERHHVPALDHHHA